MKSFAFHLLPFQLVIPNFLSYSVEKEKILGTSSGAEFQKQSKHGET